MIEQPFTHEVLEKALKIVRKKSIFRKLMAIEKIRKQPFFGVSKRENAGKVVKFRKIEPL